MRKEAMSMILGIKLVLFLFFCICSSNVQAEPIDVVYPKAIKNDRRTEYLLGVLKLALDKSDHSYRLREYSPKMTQSRKIWSLIAGNISVIWYASNYEMEKKIDPIKIPIYGGLMGYRIFIIHKDTQAMLSSVTDLESLRSFTMGQGIGWDDAIILKEAGFTVNIAPYNNLFIMVSRKRFDLMPRAPMEAYVEVEHRQADFPSLRVEKNIGIHYPKAVFMYVRKGNSQLKKIISLGLEKAYEDGSFNQFFRNHPFVKSALQKANIKKRHWFELNNPFFSKEDEKQLQRYFDKVSFKE